MTTLVLPNCPCTSFYPTVIGQLSVKLGWEQEHGQALKNSEGTINPFLNVSRLAPLLAAGP